MKLKTDGMDDSPAATGGASGKGVYDPMSNENMTPNAAPTPAPEQDAPALVLLFCEFFVNLIKTPLTTRL